MKILARILLFPLALFCYICPLCIYGRLARKLFIIKNMSRICPFCWAARKIDDLRDRPDQKKI